MLTWCAVVMEWWPHGQIGSAQFSHKAIGHPHKPILATLAIKQRFGVLPKWWPNHGRSRYVKDSIFSCTNLFLYHPIFSVLMDAWETKATHRKAWALVPNPAVAVHSHRAGSILVIGWIIKVPPIWALKNTIGVGSIQLHWLVSSPDGGNVHIFRVKSA